MIREFMRKYIWRKKTLNLLGAIAGLSVFYIAVTELNNLCAPLIGDWTDANMREVWSFLGWHWYLATGAWYNMMMLGLGVGLVIFGLSLWFWD